MMDCVVPGGVAFDLAAGAAPAGGAVRRDRGELQALRAIYDEHAGLQDRFAGTGRVSAELAARLGLTGLAARASGQARDLRCDQAWPPYDALAVKAATHAGGDVAARVAVRFDEVFESLRLIRAIVAGLPAGRCAPSCTCAPQARAWRRLGRGLARRGAGRAGTGRQGGQARVRRCHCHDPSWQNWPVLEHAVIGNIVPDFPLINKSFNLSYSGHDL